MGICCMTQGTQRGVYNNLRGVGTGKRWEGDSTTDTPVVNSCWCMTEIKPVV